MCKAISSSLVIIISVFVYVIFTEFRDGYSLDNLPQYKISRDLPFKEGERFLYEIRYKDIKIGEAVLTFNGESRLNGKKVYFVTCSTTLPSIKDAEDLYAETNTFLPVEVHRSIKKRFGFDDNITEIYDQRTFKVHISSKSKLRSKSFSIQKSAPIHNAILLVYYYRSKKDFTKGERSKINLPTVEFEVLFDGVEHIATPLGEYEAYVFTSNPPRFKLWLSKDTHKIPLKIQTPNTLGYSMLIKSIGTR